MPTKIRSPVGRDTRLFAYVRNQTAERAKRGFPVDPVLFPDASIRDKCAAPLGLGLRVLPYSQGSRPWANSCRASGAGASTRSAAFLPTLPSQSTYTQIKMTHYRNFALNMTKVVRSCHRLEPRLRSGLC